MQLPVAGSRAGLFGKDEDASNYVSYAVVLEEGKGRHSAGLHPL